MSHNSSYYANFLEKFRLRTEKQLKYDAKTPNDKPVVELPIDTSDSSTISDQTLNKGVESKRSQKLLRKDHIEGIKSFLSTKVDLNFTSKIQYTQIIAEFLDFSPDCEIDDYLNFLKFKSSTLGIPKLNEFVIEGTLIKYSNVLKQYIYYVHQKEVAQVKTVYYKKPYKVPTCPYPKITKKDAFIMYQNLLSKGKYEDGVMIHSMYELGLEPYRLSLLKWDSIAEDKTIKYFDHRSRSVKELKLSDNLYSELIYLKSWKRLKNLQINNEERKSLDGTTIVGGFIFSSKPTGIFNKFKRGFGGCLKGFNITPKDLILLSKCDEKSGNKKLYSRTNC